MAAGLGTRLRPFTDSTPKPLLPLMGIPLLQWTLDSAKTAGCTRAVINLHYRAEDLRVAVPKLDREGIEVAWSDETKQILGSGGGIAHALPLLGERFFVMNGDTLCAADLHPLIERHLKNRNQGVQATLLLKRKPPHSPYAGIEVRSDRITKFRSPSGTCFYVGTAILERSLFKNAPTGEWDLVEKILSPAAEQGAVAYLDTSDLFLDIGSPEQWARAHFEIMRSTKKFPRVQQVCQKHADDVWSLKGQLPPRSAKGPSFLGVIPTSDGDIGPQAVIYDVTSGPPWKQGLWYGGHSVSLLPGPRRIP